MKLQLFTAFVAAGLLLAGCAVEETLMEGGSITAVIESDATRTSVTDDGTFTWSAGDQVWLETTSGSVLGTLSTGAGTANATFSYGSFFGEMTGKAVYPYNSSHSISGRELSFVLPASYDLGSNLSNTNAAMYGLNVGGTIKFNHLAGVMRFVFKNVPVGADKFQITLDKKINGEFIADLTEAYPVIETSAAVSESEKTITLDFDALTSVSDICLFVPLPIGTYTTLGLELWAGDRSLWSYSNEVTNKIARRSLLLMPEVKFDCPVADLLDVRFNSDGSAEDISDSKRTVSLFPGSTHMNYYSDEFSGYVAYFNNPFNKSITSGFYKIDYENDEEYKKRIADGHTLEMMFRMEQYAAGEYEIKPFSSMEGGGTGFLISKPSAYGGDITFLPNVTADGNSNWIWTQSGVVPKLGVYYHVVGIWNKDEGKSYIYINGELKGSQNAVGEFKFPSDERNWFCIGADPSKNSAANAAFKGDVAIARMYDAPLDERQVRDLWDKVKDIQQNQEDPVIITDLEMLPDATVKPGCSMYIYGKGFQDGDILRLGGRDGYNCKTFVGDDHLKVIIPEGLSSGMTNLTLIRDKSSTIIGTMNLTVSSSIFPIRNPKIVAHRGYHPGKVAENSLASLIEAQKVGVYGSEFDVYVTTDDVVVLYHDPKLTDGRRIDACSYDDIKDFTLENGEKIPTFEQYLEQAKKYPGVKLVCEIKTHQDETKNLRAVNACAAAVNKHGLAHQMVWIAFNYNICKKLVELYPDSQIQYLNGDKAPSVVYADGINGIDYKDSKLKDSWITQAHSLGMEVNVWNLDDTSDMLKYISKGVDYITTNESEKGLKLVGRPYITE